jgi:hypothetical protein
METTTTVNQPWASAQPYMKDIYANAQNNYQNSMPSYYGGQTYADWSPQTIEAMQMMEHTARNNPIAEQAGLELGKTLNGQYLGDSNPYINTVVNDAAGDINQAVGSNFAKGGRFGSNAFVDTVADKVGDMSGNVRFQNYNAERQNMQRGLALAPQVQGMQYADAQQLGQVGQAYQGQTQLGIDEAMNRHNFEQNKDESALANYSSLISGLGSSGYGTTQSTSPTSGGSTGANIIGGGAMGYGLGEAFSDNKYAPWIGAGLGALGGGLGLFG